MQIAQKSLGGDRQAEPIGQPALLERPSSRLATEEVLMISCMTRRFTEHLAACLDLHDRGSFAGRYGPRSGTNQAWMAVKPNQFEQEAAGKAFAVNSLEV